MREVSYTMQNQRKADSFGTFLATVQSSETTALNPQVKLLQALSAAGPTSIPKLAAASGLELTKFLETLRTLQELRLVAVADGDLVTLTQAGEEIAKKSP